MKIAMTGSHRTGKTTLAERLGLELDLAMIYTEVSSLFKDSPAKKEDLNGQSGFFERIEIQNRIADHLTNKIANADEYSIFDRSFIDVFGYSDVFLSKIIPGLPASVRSNSIVSYHEHLSSITRLFDCVDFHIVVQPGIQFEEAGKSCSIESQEAVSESILLAVEKNLAPHEYFVVPKSVTDLEERVSLCRQAIIEFLSYRSM